MLKRGWSIDVVAPPQGPLFRHAMLGEAVSWHPLDLSKKITDPAFTITVARWMLFSRRFRDCVIYGNGYVTLKWLVIAQTLWGPRFLSPARKLVRILQLAARPLFIAAHPTILRDQ